MADAGFVESSVEMEEMLRREAWGCLGVSTADRDPYVVPVNYAYVGGKILFHCGLKGKKLDCIRANPNVCFTVASQPGAVREHPGGRPCHVDSDSVICYGEARIVEDVQERADLLSRFNRAFRPGAEDVATDRAVGCGVVEITVREMTGRRERADQRTLWRYIP